MLVFLVVQSAVLPVPSKGVESCKYMYGALVALDLVAR